MRKFLIESTLFLALVILTFYIIFLRADGKTDPFYLRFTSPKQHSLILGTSRAAQGIIPSVLNKELSRNDVYNYSFTIGMSPYGPEYLKSIKKKLDHDTKDGIFILAVDPWSISSDSKDPENPDQFKEKKQALGKTQFVNMNPNFLYFISSYSDPFYHLLLKQKAHTTLHEDGWLEVNIKMDSARMQKRIENKVKQYRKKNLRIYKFSQVRLDYLVKTADFLKNYGKVYLVRLPVHPLMMEIDDALIPGFNEKMHFISGLTGSPFLDMTYLNESTVFTDGNHIFRESGIEVTARIGEWIAGQSN